MKIYTNMPYDSQEVVGKGNKVNAKEAKDAAKDKAEASKGATGDRVNLSARARELDEMKNSIEQLPEVRNDKVEAIGTSIRNGTYKIDAQAIAGKMLDEIV